MVNLKEFLNCHSPGYVIDIYNKGKITEFVFGNRSIVPNIAINTKNTLYDIASVTKVYTSTLIYMAYEEGLLDLNDTVYNIENNFIHLKNVKIIDLLSHNQNIWTEGYLGNTKNQLEFYNILYTAYVKEKIPTYVDVHYIILTVLLEKIYNKSYEEICTQKIINKLGLKNTVFNPNPDIVASNNFEHTENGIVDYIYPGLTHDTKGRVAKTFGLNLGHAAIFTTGNDLLQFLKTFLDKTLLKEETIKLMLQHRDTNKQNYEALKNLVPGNDINELYDEILKRKIDIRLPKTYNNMGTRYNNDIKKINDVPNIASNSSISFSGYTGPMFTIDFEQEIIVVIMCNVIHNSKLNREERKEKTVKIMNMIFESITAEENNQ